MPQIGDAVTVVDSTSKTHEALVTCVFTWPGDEEHASINAVFVSNDAAKDDPYGRQIERLTSLPHQTHQPAHGYYWK